MTPALLAALEPGSQAVVRHVKGDPAAVRRLMELGLVPGTPVELVRRAPLGDPIELRVRGTHLSIRRTEAERIHVDAV
jgi:ferrous iron transport protein A